MTQLTNVIGVFLNLLLCTISGFNTWYSFEYQMSG